MNHIAITAIRDFLSNIVTGNSKIDPNNSTTDILLAGATFTGEKVSLLGSATVSINIFADQDSATDGMKFEFSSDGVNWDDQEQIFNLDAAVSKARRFQYGVNHAWFRVIYVNGAVDQTAFRLQTILHRSSQITTIHRLIDEESPDRSATLVKAVLMARKAGVGGLININSTAGGNLKVSLEESDPAAQLKVLPFSPIKEGGMKELTGINEPVAQDEYSGSVEFPLGGTYSGEILKIKLYFTEAGTGSILTPSGTLFIYDTDPTITSGDSDMGSTAGLTSLAEIDIASDDWNTDGTIGLINKTIAEPFHPVTSLWVVFKNTGATTINSDAGDDEKLEVNLWYMRHS